MVWVIYTLERYKDGLRENTEFGYIPTHDCGGYHVGRVDSIPELAQKLHWLEQSKYANFNDVEILRGQHAATIKRGLNESELEVLAVELSKGTESNPERM